MTTLPKILKKQGYDTSFFFGNLNSSQGFEKYSKICGFDKFYGKNEYRGPDAFDGKWGIFDEEFLDFFADEIDLGKSLFYPVYSQAPPMIPT
jgi:phosphoglycerol transferase MdoB-like AlkP superfamily enzyme